MSKISKANLLWGLALLVAMVISGCATFAPAEGETFHVTANCETKPLCFTTIQSALDAAAKDTDDHWITIDVDAGNYFEKITISRNKISLRGQGEGRTRLYFDAVAQSAGHYHRRNWGTPGSATLTVNADQVEVSGMTIENSFDYLSNDALADGDPRKISNSQAVAVLLDVDSDRVVFSKTAILGYQDTLFANGKRVYIRDSVIAGNVDFIFGNGSVLIEDSTIKTRRRAVPYVQGGFDSFIVAPSTQLAQPIGIVIYRSRLVREAGVPDGAIALGRPWHPTTSFADGRYADPNAVGQASFIDCFMEAHIHADHWTSMNGTARDGSKNDVFRAQDSRFYESGSYGPGARHNDIGLKWSDPLPINEIHKRFFEGFEYRHSRYSL